MSRKPGASEQYTLAVGALIEDIFWQKKQPRKSTTRWGSFSGSDLR